MGEQITKVRAPGGVRADLRRDPAEVRKMFDAVARGYDRTNFLLSLGQVRMWRRVVTAAVSPRPSQRILDLAAGTGRSSVPLVRSGATVIAADFSPGMIAEGSRRFGSLPGLRFVQADAVDLPFDDGEFDVVTISFSLRNVAEPRAALAEMKRVVSPGGRLVICEFSHPPSRVMSALYRMYGAMAFPALARLSSSNPEAYRYLRESIEDWSEPRELSSWLQEAGWVGVKYRRLSAGIVALHIGVNPPAE